MFGIDFTPLSLAGQLLSLAAMVLTVLSFQMKSRKGILALQIAGNLLFLFSYACLASWAAVGMNVIFLIRNSVYLTKNKYRVLQSPLTAVFFCVLCAAVGFLTWSSPRDALVILGSLFGCVALYMNDQRKLLAIKSGDSVCWLVYNLLAGVSGGILCEVCNLASIGLALARKQRVQKAERSSVC